MRHGSKSIKAVPHQNKEDVVKTSLYCAFEISPRENCGSEATGCVPPKTLRLLRDLMQRYWVSERWNPNW